VCASSVNNEDPNLPIPIIIGSLDSIIHRAPTAIPIECWYYGAASSIIVDCLNTINHLDIYILNVDTGEFSYEEISLAFGVMMIPFANTPGFHRIEFIVNKNQTFVGNFNVP